MKGDKAAAAKSRPEWRSCRETNEGEQSSPEWRSGRETRAAQNGDHAGSQMKGDKAAWRLWGSATQSLGSKNPYSFQLSREKNKTYSNVSKLIILTKDQNGNCETQTSLFFTQTSRPPTPQRPRMTNIKVCCRGSQGKSTSSSKKRSR